MINIELNHVTKTFPGTEHPAVKDVSLTIESGSIVTLLGPSGCGKTTTLRLIAGFERATSGSINLAGRTVSSDSVWVPPEKRGIGMVFQDYALFPHLDVFHNIAFGYKGKDVKQRLEEVLHLVGLKGFEKRLIHELSGGQQQRVALARALAKRPAVVMLDEPFSNLDADLRSCMRVDVQRIIKKAGTTAIFVSHDQRDAFVISDKVVVMKDGVIQQIGTPREIYQYPDNRFVASFVGQSNMLEGVMRPDGRSVATVIGNIPCDHTHGMKAEDEVLLSIRPDSFERDDAGDIEGRVMFQTYTGDSNEVTIQVPREGKDIALMVHLHPEEVVNPGDWLRFKVLPDFVAVMGERPSSGKR